MSVPGTPGRWKHSVGAIADAEAERSGRHENSLFDGARVGVIVRVGVEKLTRGLTRYPLAVLFTHVMVTVLFGRLALQIRIESSIESLLPAESPEVRYYNEVRKLFGSDDIAVIGVRADNLFDGRTLEKIARVTDAVAAIDGVDRVLSITNAVDPSADVFQPPRLLPHIPPRPEEIIALREKLAAIPLFGKNLVSDDLRGAAINVSFAALSDTEYASRRIDAQIKAILARESGPESFYYTGAAHLKQSAVALMQHDLARFTPLALGLVILVLWFSFRTFLGVLLPLVSVVMAVIWTLGVMVWAGKSLTLGTFVLPPLLLVLGSEYAIHVVTRYLQTGEDSGQPDDRVLRTLRHVRIPVLVSGLTTMVGFASLMVNRISAIRDLGLFAVIGLGFLVETSLIFLPAALRFLAPRFRSSAHAELSRWLPRLLTWFGNQALVHRRRFLWLTLLVVGGAIAGALRIRVDSDFLSYFDPSSEVRQANELINRSIVGSNPFSLVIEGGGPGLLKRWEVLKQVKDLQRFLNALPGITASISLVDYLELLERGLLENASGDILLDAEGRPVEVRPRPFWEDPGNLPPVIELVERHPETFAHVVTADFSKANVLVRTSLSGSSRIESVLAQVVEYGRRHFPADICLRPTGNLVLLTGTTSDIVMGQVKSLIVALAVIFAVMSLMFLSARIGFLTVLPNVVPIVIFFGVLGWSGIFLNMGTSVIATISLGVAVDSAIHYMAHLNRELKRHADQVTALQRTIAIVGVPVVFSTLALLLGFLTFAFSGFVPIRNFGILSSVTMSTALVSNVILLPTLLAGVKIITLWDLVALKLGEEPTRTIPLFAGLRPSQARIVVLMGRLKKFAAGQVIVRQHEMGTEMYVILHGTTEVWAGSDGERQRIAELRRGDVFGEMALVRHVRRSADVVATGPVEVLAIDERFIQRIQARYPRIAAKVFLNLTRILSDRLQRITERLVEPH